MRPRKTVGQSRARGELMCSSSTPVIASARFVSPSSSATWTAMAATASLSLAGPNGACARLRRGERQRLPEVGHQRSGLATITPHYGARPRGLTPRVRNARRLEQVGSRGPRLETREHGGLQSLRKPPPCDSRQNELFERVASEIPVTRRVCSGLCIGCGSDGLGLARQEAVATRIRRPAR